MTVTLKAQTGVDYPNLFKVLGDLVENNREMFHCPSDKINPSVVIPVAGTEYETYFDQEGMSYEYRDTIVAKKTREEVRKARGDLSSSLIFVANDFDPFHGSAGEDGSRNYIYMDGHVDAIKVNE